MPGGRPKHQPWLSDLRGVVRQGSNSMSYACISDFWSLDLEHQRRPGWIDGTRNESARSGKTVDFRNQFAAIRQKPLHCAAACQEACTGAMSFAHEISDRFAVLFYRAQTFRNAWL